jgi:hypothetical protein
MIYQTKPTFRDRNDGIGQLRLNRLAHYSPGFIEVPQMRVDFTTNLRGEIVFDLPISISIQNSNRVPIARYTAENLVNIPLQIREQISDELVKCRREQSGVFSFAKTLWELTTSSPRVLWRTESIYPGVCEPESELRPCIPPLDEFLRNPECLNHSFYSTRTTPLSQERIEVKVDPASANISFTISLTPKEASPRNGFNQRFIIDGIPSTDCRGVDTVEHVLRKALWDTMEVFWAQGGMGVYQYLVQNKPFHDESLAPPSPLSVRHFLYDGQARIGAHLSMEASPHIAQLSITHQPPGDTNQNYSQSGSVQLVFTSDSAGNAHDSKDAPNALQHKFERSLIRLIQASGEHELEKGLTELLMNARSEVFVRPSSKELLGDEVFKILSCLSKTKEKNSWNPSSAELIRFLEGVQTLEFYLDTSKQKNRLVLFDSLRIDVFPDQTVTLTCSNPLRVKIEAHFKILSDYDFGTILTAFDNQITPASTTTDTMELMSLLHHLASRDPENWIVSSGSSTLPAWSDHLGQDLLNKVALPITTQYLKLRTIREDVEYSEQSNLTVEYSAPGVLEISLGEDYHRYRIKFSFQDRGLLAIEIIPQIDSPASLKKPRIYTYKSPRPIDDERSESFYETTLKLFFALVEPNHKVGVFAKSQLRTFLDKEFQ